MEIIVPDDSKTEKDQGSADRSQNWQKMLEFKEDLQSKYAEMDVIKPKVKMAKISEAGIFTLNFSEIMIRP